MKPIAFTILVVSTLIAGRGAYGLARGEDEQSQSVLLWMTLQWVLVGLPSLVVALTKRGPATSGAGDHETQSSTVAGDVEFQGKVWLRPPYTADFLGPFTASQITARFMEGNLAKDLEALRDCGQSDPDLRRSKDWVPLFPEGSSVPVIPAAGQPVAVETPAGQRMHDGSSDDGDIGSGEAVAQSKFYFVQSKGEESGPFTLGQLKTMWDSGRITADAKCRPDATKPWTSIISLALDTMTSVRPVGGPRAVGEGQSLRDSQQGEQATEPEQGKPKRTAARVIVALFLLLGLGVVYGVWDSARAREAAKAAAVTCCENQRQIDGAKQQWALENRKNTLDTPTAGDLDPYIRVPIRCPAGGSYLIGEIRTNPACSYHGDLLQDPSRVGSFEAAISPLTRDDSSAKLIVSKPAALTKAQWKARVVSRYGTAASANFIADWRVKTFKEAMGEPDRTQTIGNNAYWYYECVDGTIRLKLYAPNLGSGVMQGQIEDN